MKSAYEFPRDAMSLLPYDCVAFVNAPADSFDVVSSAGSAPGGYSHSHIVAVLLADLANPPAAGVTYLTSSAEGHSHQVTLSKSDLADVQEGKTRSESTTVVSGHQHTFAFSKP